MIDHRFAPFPFEFISSRYDCVASWRDILEAAKRTGKWSEEELQYADIRVAPTTFLDELGVLWDGGDLFANLDDVGGESVWRLYWKLPQRFHWNNEEDL